MNRRDAFDWIDGRSPELFERLMHLSGINSGTANQEGVNRVGREFSELFTPLADSLELVPSATAERVDINGESVEDHYGDMISCVKRPDAPVQVLLVGHLDTVFPADSHFQQPRQVDANTINGPGVADMKGGILVMLTALEAFEQIQTDDRLGWRVLLNADEETGSHGSAAMLAAAAGSAQAGLIYEPALADGTLSRARKGSGNFTLVANGVAAHAGREFGKGRNAILALLEAARRVAALTDLEQGITVNVARISGGTAFNVVPERAVCQFNIRCHTAQQQQQLTHRLQEILAELNGQDPDLSLELSGGFTRPPKTISPANQLLMDWATECGAALDLELKFNDTGGCCDGNNLAAAGLPNIDTLGVLGGHIHTDQEFMLLDSLPERAKLSLLMLERLAREGEELLACQQESSQDAD